MPKPIVIVTDYFPPDPGNRARRMLERAKSLSRHGHAVLVLVPDRKPLCHLPFRLPSRVHVLRVKPMAWRLLPSVNAADYRLLRLPLFQPLRPFIGFLRMVPPAVVALRHLRMAARSVLYTMNNPVSLHLIGLFSSRRFGAWIAELRDPISSWESARFSVWKPLVALFERRLMRQADAIAYRSGLPVNHAELTRKYPAANILQLPDYGVDYSDFENSALATPASEGGLIATYAGGYYRIYDPNPLFQAITQFLRDRIVLDLMLFGDPPPCALDTYPTVSYRGKVAYWDLVEQYSNSHFLVMFTRSKPEDTATFYPSKFSELIAAGKPILLIGNRETELFEEIASNRLGACALNEAPSILRALDAIAEMISSNSYNLSYRIANKHRFSNEPSEQAFHDTLETLD